MSGRVPTCPSVYLRGVFLAGAAATLGPKGDQRGELSGRRDKVREVSHSKEVGLWIHCFSAPIPELNEAVAKSPMGIAEKLESCCQIRGRGLSWDGRLWQPKMRSHYRIGGAKDSSVSQDHPGRTLWSSGSELDALGGGGPGTSPILGTSHNSVFPSLPPQDLCEVGHPLSAIPPIW